MKLLLCFLLIFFSNQASYCLSNEEFKHELHVRNKSFIDAYGIEHRNKSFYDGHDREILLRGMNVSGTSKLMENGFRPFKSYSDAVFSLSNLRALTGSNVIRLLTSWEAVNPEYNKISYSYLDDFIDYIKIAAENKIYIVIDFHQDIASRHLFKEKSLYTGDGMPEFIVKGAGLYQQEYCGVICPSWSQHQLTDSAVRSMMKGFWDNIPIKLNGNKKIKIQDIYFDQLAIFLKYLKNNLTPLEFSYILGLEPLNEPFDGGMDVDVKEWSLTKLWPIYKKIRLIMDTYGWEKKFVFTQPLIFWNTNAGSVLAPKSGGGYLFKQDPRFIFTPHFYDAGRQATDIRDLKNGAYLPNFDEIRKEWTNWNTAAFISEFGAYINKIGKTDTIKTIHYMYQGLDATDKNHSIKDRFLDFYSPPISASQWHWDIYSDNHNEYQNMNLNKLTTKKDAWNNEDFSPIKEDNKIINWRGIYPNNLSLTHQRIFPRAVQGDIISYYYNDNARDMNNKIIKDVALKFDKNEYLQGHIFALLIYQNKGVVNKQTEIFIPNTLNLKKLVIITNNNIVKGLNNNYKILKNTNLQDILILKEENLLGKDSYNILLEDKKKIQDNEENIKYILIFLDEYGISDNVLEKIQQEMSLSVLKKKSPIFLIGEMQTGEHAGYKNYDYPDVNVSVP